MEIRLDLGFRFLPRAVFDIETSRREEVQGSFLPPPTHRCPGRARRHLSNFNYPLLCINSEWPGIELGRSVARGTKVNALIHYGPHFDFLITFYFKLLLNGIKISNVNLAIYFSKWFYPDSTLIGRNILGVLYYI